MLLGGGQLAQPADHLSGRAGLAGLGQRFGQVAGDRERARVLHALPLGVVPDRSQAARRLLRLALQQRGQAHDPPRLQPVPLQGVRVAALQHLRR